MGYRPPRAQFHAKQAKPGDKLTARLEHRIEETANDPAFTAFVRRVANTSEFRRAMISPGEWRRYMTVFAMGYADCLKANAGRVTLAGPSLIVGGRFG